MTAGGGQNSVLVHFHFELARDVAAPSIVTRNAVGISCLHRTEKIRANEIPTVIFLTESLEFTV